MTNTHRDDDDYLWNGSGEPDPEIVRLERMLAELRHRGEAPRLPLKPGRAIGRWSLPIVALATAASLVLVSAVAWYAAESRRGRHVHTIASTPAVEKSAAPSATRTHDANLKVGEWLVTDAVSRARVAVGDIGSVDVEPNTRVQLVEAHGREHRLSLERGTIHARIWAPPKLFFVKTPSATAVDLGCEYTLQVDAAGAGLLRVLLGWVAFENGGRESFIPQGAMCATRPGAGPGTPRYEDAPTGYGEALDRLDFARPDDPQHAAAFDLVVSSARPRDALTLWHMLTRGSPEERARVYDRLAVLAPPPPGVGRREVLAGNRAALERWWNDLGAASGGWWPLEQKK